MGQGEVGGGREVVNVSLFFLKARPKTKHIIFSFFLPSLPPSLPIPESQAAAYEFTTLTCIPGNIIYNDTKIQLLDLPGEKAGREGGREGGRGRVMHYLSSHTPETRWRAISTHCLPPSPPPFLPSSAQQRLLRYHRRRRPRERSRARSHRGRSLIRPRPDGAGWRERASEQPPGHPREGVGDRGLATE